MSLNLLRSGQAHARLVMAGVVLGALAFAAGCGAGYRAVVTPINPSGPPPQPLSLVAVVSSPSSTSPGVASIIDYSGDTIVAQAPIGPGPLTFTMDETGSNGYTVNSDGTLTNFPISSALQQKQVQYSTLPTASSVVNLFSPSAGLWAPDLNGDVIDVLTGFPASFKLAIPVAPTPVAVFGPGVVGLRNYALTDNFADPSGVACNVSPRTVPGAGEADAIENATFTVSARIPVGKCPVYGLQSPDTKRFFVLNRGDDTITVINSQNNTLDACTPFYNQSGQLVTCHPSLPLSTSAGLSGANVPAIAGPVYAEFNAATNQIVVADYDGGTISIIDVTLDQYGNDGPTFGTTYSVPVGTNPAAVTVLFDGSRAYAANQADSTVTIVNMGSHTVEKTLPVNGHPRGVVSTQNSIYGKVYVASPDSPYVSIVRTDQDIIDATVLVQGNVVDVRTSTQNASAGNAIAASRTPGHGQPCYLPPTLLSPSAITAASCRSATLP